MTKLQRNKLNHLESIIESKLTEGYTLSCKYFNEDSIDITYSKGDTYVSVLLGTNRFVNVEDMANEFLRTLAENTR